MTMDLISASGERHYTHQSWKMLLDLARRSGWQPAGAEEPEEVEEPDDEEEAVIIEEPDAEDEEYEEEPVLELNAADYALPPDSSLAQALASLFPSAQDPVLLTYFCNSGYRVTAEDAQALAEALEQALPDVPDHDAMEDKTFEHPAMPGVRLVNLTTPINPYEWFGGKKDLLQDFIAFCREGGFEIW